VRTQSCVQSAAEEARGSEPPVEADGRDLDGKVEVAARVRTIKKATSGMAIA
jgi:hypothetical protein